MNNPKRAEDSCLKFSSKSFHTGRIEHPERYGKASECDDRSANPGVSHRVPYRCWIRRFLWCLSDYPACRQKSSSHCFFGRRFIFRCMRARDLLLYDAVYRRAAAFFHCAGRTSWRCNLLFYCRFLDHEDLKVDYSCGQSRVSFYLSGAYPPCIDSISLVGPQDPKIPVKINDSVQKIWYKSKIPLETTTGFIV